mmetsp:Transcript_9269/g.24485  ORF Transcript_9269/g.24485 Transcript_9269/m.24485 type:complete len:353 (+) Transcript_9269:98-1156(+)|eukprot:CAMPEP_0185833804 /NCGR_PEP_ID=MMETSP1353-20130828/3501_1 /TAXON_ID=1077150 /ORGANISM="Erythrolobus australicus, Strain CCMP3124" /LENGTH=352 /DNA_ID=CAMNT_0028532133 /DNA_START=172 /DNA_END=1230 /DNA_ORIENTATION=+
MSAMFVPAHAAARKPALRSASWSSQSARCVAGVGKNARCAARTLARSVEMSRGDRGNGRDERKTNPFAPDFDPLYDLREQIRDPLGRNKTNPFAKELEPLVDLPNQIRDSIAPISMSPATRAVVGVGVVIAVTTILSAALHVASMAVFFGVSIFAVPLMLTAAMSMGAMIFFGTLLLGSGLVLFTGPIFAIINLVKLAFPLAIGGVIVAKLFPGTYGQFKRIATSFAASLRNEPVSADSFNTAQSAAEEPYSKADMEADALRSFDARLRGRSRRPAAVSSWSVQDVAAEMALCGLGELADRFVREGIDGRAALTLTERDIRAELGNDLTLGEKKRLMYFLRELKAIEKSSAA